MRKTLKSADYASNRLGESIIYDGYAIFAGGADLKTNLLK